MVTAESSFTLPSGLMIDLSKSKNTPSRRKTSRGGCCVGGCAAGGGVGGGAGIATDTLAELDVVPPGPEQVIVYDVVDVGDTDCVPLVAVLVVHGAVQLVAFVEV